MIPEEHEEVNMNDFDPDEDRRQRTMSDDDEDQMHGHGPGVSCATQWSASRLHATTSSSLVSFYNLVKNADSFVKKIKTFCVDSAYDYHASTTPQICFELFSISVIVFM